MFAPPCLGHRTFAVLVLATAVASGFQPATASDIKVVATSKPVHSLVAAVMEGVGTPTLIVEGNASPHSFTLKPSGARAIATADVFFRISESIEPFTTKLVTTLPKSVKVVTLADTPGLAPLPRRTGGTFAGGHSHGHGHDHDDEDKAGGADGHVWLDPANARIMVTAIANAIAVKAPQHTARIEANAKALDARIAAMAEDIAGRMKPLAGKPFILFHDATQYFERRFGIAAGGSITVSPDVQPSAKRLNAVRAKIKSTGAVCVFREPGYQEKLVTAVTEGTLAKGGLIDPEGLNLEAGPGLYEALLRDLAAGFAACLGGTN
ncbi:MAG: zinc ABC transporter substrate-binding protein [Hyphomicrobium aestuarii]|nr:zinc ABC transporter substrate-binding protein [Hyphomicrobium aestuarii]